MIRIDRQPAPVTHHRNHTALIRSENPMLFLVEKRQQPWQRLLRPSKACARSPITKQTLSDPFETTVAVSTRNRQHASLAGSPLFVSMDSVCPSLIYRDHRSNPSGNNHCCIYQKIGNNPGLACSH
jgi:hypothetical protein